MKGFVISRFGRAELLLKLIGKCYVGESCVIISYFLDINENLHDAAMHQFTATKSKKKSICFFGKKILHIFKFLCRKMLSYLFFP